MFSDKKVINEKHKTQLTEIKSKSVYTDFI